jgi:hypothetical protein
MLSTPIAVSSGNPLQDKHRHTLSTGSTHSRGPSLSHQASIVTHATGYTSHTRRTSRSSKYRGFGGFPMPHILFSRFLARYFPKLTRKLTRTVTIPVVTSLTPQREDAPAGIKSVSYISFDAIVGRNSFFHLLTRPQVEELGGVEYRALNALLWIVGAVGSPTCSSCLSC